MKRDEHVNDIPDIEIVDLENETVQDTDFGKSDISDDFEGNPDDEYEENNVKIDNEIFETNGIDFSQYLGMKVTAYYKADDSG